MVETLVFVEVDLVVLLVPLSATTVVATVLVAPLEVPPVSTTASAPAPATDPIAVEIVAIFTRRRALSRWLTELRTLANGVLVSGARRAGFVEFVIAQTVLRQGGDQLDDR